MGVVWGKELGWEQDVKGEALFRKEKRRGGWVGGGEDTERGDGGGVQVVCRSTDIVPINLMHCVCVLQLVS